MEHDRQPYRSQPDDRIEKIIERAYRLGGGLSKAELYAAYAIFNGVPPHGTVVQLGCWRGASFIVALEALRDRKVSFIAVDCFDLAGIAEAGGMPPVAQAELEANIRPHVSESHSVEIVKANTLSLRTLPAADVMFVDANHHLRYALHDATLAKIFTTPNGTMLFHDYGSPDWPDVKVAVDFLFGRQIVEVVETLACVRLGPLGCAGPPDPGSLL